VFKGPENLVATL